MRFRNCVPDVSPNCVPKIRCQNCVLRMRPRNAAQNCVLGMPPRNCHSQNAFANSQNVFRNAFHSCVRSQKWIRWTSLFAWPLKCLPELRFHLSWASGSDRETTRHVFDVKLSYPNALPNFVRKMRAWSVECVPEIRSRNTVNIAPKMSSRFAVPKCLPELHFQILFPRSAFPNCVPLKYISQNTFPKCS